MNPTATSSNSLFRVITDRFDFKKWLINQGFTEIEEPAKVYTEIMFAKSTILAAFQRCYNERQCYVFIGIGSQMTLEFCTPLQKGFRARGPRIERIFIPQSEALALALFELVED